MHDPTRSPLTHPKHLGAPPPPPLEVSQPIHRHGLQWFVAIPRRSHLLPRHRPLQVDYAMCSLEVFPRCEGDLRFQEQNS